MNLQTFKGKQVAAKKGFDLLKSKSDALKVKTQHPSSRSCLRIKISSNFLFCFTLPSHMLLISQYILSSYFVLSVVGQV